MIKIKNRKERELLTAALAKMIPEAEAYADNRGNPLDKYVCMVVVLTSAIDFLIADINGLNNKYDAEKIEQLKREASCT